MLAVNEKGQKLCAFKTLAESDCLQHQPLTHALVALWKDNRVLMVFADYNQQWQFPGGLVEPAETPREAAARELLEETGQVADLHFAGVMEWDLGSTRVLHQSGKVYGALFCATLQELQPFQENDEVSQWAWVNPSQPQVLLPPLIEALLQQAWQHQLRL